MLKNFFNFCLEVTKIVLISLVIIIPIRHFIIQPFYVKGASMEPNFYDHEYLIIDEITYRFTEPKRGDIIVFRYPRNPQEFFIKRIIALPGEKIQIKDGNIYIFNGENKDGFLLKEDYIANDIKTYSTMEDVVGLDKDEFFVLGDNRNSSKDSRSFGPVNKSFVIGRVVFRGWPFDRVNLFEAPIYNY